MLLQEKTGFIKKEGEGKKKPTPLGFLGKQIAPPTTTEKRAAHLCSLPVPIHNIRYDLCQTCATGLFNSVQSMIKHCALYSADKSKFNVASPSFDRPQFCGYSVN